MVKCTVNPCVIVCNRNAPTRVHSVVFNDSLSLALIDVPKASQSSPHKNTSCLGNLLLLLLSKLSLAGALLEEFLRS